MRILVLIFTVLVFNQLVACTKNQTHVIQEPFLPEITPIELLETASLGLYEVKCWFKRTTAQPPLPCYQLVVPQDYAQPEKGSVSFPIVHLKVTERLGPPILHVGGGGPGNAIGINEEEFVNQMLYTYGAISLELGRDLIVIDPRGTGVSSPKLWCVPCRQYIKDSLDAVYDPEVDYKKTKSCYQQCRDESEEKGIDLGQYHTMNITQDLMSLRRALDIDMWSIYGVSYGGVYAMSLAHHDPDGVEFLILDAPAILSQGKNRFENFNFLRMFNFAVNRCLSKKSCLKKFPALKSEFLQVLSTMEENPVSLTVPHEGQQIKIVVDVDVFHYYIGRLLYWPNGYDEFPVFINALANYEKGDKNLAKEGLEILESFFSEFLELDDWEDRYMSYLSSQAHYCYEEVPFLDLKQLRKELKDVDAHSVLKNYHLDILKEEHDICPNIHDNKADLKQYQYFPLTVPTIALQGTDDPAVLSTTLTSVHQGFLNADILVFKETAHGVLNYEPCGLIAIQQTLEGYELNESLPEWCLSRAEHYFRHRLN